MKLTALGLGVSALAVAALQVDATALAAPCRGLTTAAAKPCPLSVQVHVTQADMTNQAASETPAVATCPRGSTLVGGGILQDKLNGQLPTNGLRIHGTAPATASGAPAASGSHDPTDWLALGGFGGQGEPGDQVRSFALCSSGGPTKTLIVSKTIDGPKAAATTKKVTVTCPSSSTLIGGGAATRPASSPSLKPIGSFPSTVGGRPLAAGAQSPRSWTAVGAAGGMRFGTGVPKTTVFAICDLGPAFPTVVARTDIVDHPAGPGNLDPGSDPFAIATASCGKGTSLLGGGVLADGDAKGPDGGVPQQGVHVRGSYPSDPKGHPLGEGASAPGAWTVIVQSGGQPTPGTDTHAFALCAG
jgi:hypothetical protein